MDYDMFHTDPFNEGIDDFTDQPVITNFKNSSVKTVITTEDILTTEHLDKVNEIEEKKMNDESLDHNDKVLRKINSQLAKILLTMIIEKIIYNQELTSLKFVDIAISYAISDFFIVGQVDKFIKDYVKDLDDEKRIFILNLLSDIIVSYAISKAMDKSFNLTKSLVTFGLGEFTAMHLEKALPRHFKFSES